MSKFILLLVLFFSVSYLYSQNVGIGTIDPQATLDVVGSTKTSSLQVTAGAGQDKIMTSDNVGNAVWASAPSPNISYYNLTSSTSFTHGLVSWANITDLITTPVAGTYYVSSNLNYASGGAPLLSFALRVDGVVITNTEINGINQPNRSTIKVQGIVTVNGSQTVSTVCRRVQGEPINITDRSMVLIRLN